MTKAHEIAKYIVETGTKETTTGNYIFEFDEINQKFGADIPEDIDLYHDIIDTLFDDYADIVCETDAPIKGGVFDIIFYLEHCPNADDNDESY